MDFTFPEEYQDDKFDWIDLESRAGEMDVEFFDLDAMVYLVDWPKMQACDPTCWIVYKEQQFSVDGNMFTIHAGFTTDFSSVPKELWDEIPPYGAWLPASMAHDYLYAHRIGSREWADNVFLAMMVQHGVYELTRRLMFRAVRCFGQGPWNED